MSSSGNPIFKFISLRSSLNGLTIDPTEDIPDSQVVALLADKEVNPKDPGDEIKSKISKLPTTTEVELNGYTLTQIHKKLLKLKDYSFVTISKIEIGDDVEKKGRGKGRSGGKDKGPDSKRKKSGITLAKYAETEEFHTHYKNITDSWLVMGLSQQWGELTERYQELIRVAHLIHLLGLNPNFLKEPGIIKRILEARIIFPRSWRPARYKQHALAERHAKKLEQAEPPGHSRRARDIEQQKLEFIALSKRIQVLESIQSKADRTYRQLTLVPIEPGQPQPKSKEKNIGSQFTLIEIKSKTLDTKFYSDLEARLTEDEKIEFDNIFSDDSGVRPISIDNFFDKVSVDYVIQGANFACSNIKVWEEEEAEQLPVPDTRESSEDRPSVRTIGWGELIVANETLVKYEANEIAHIENVLSGEEKVREHERTKNTEQFTETETVEETESEKDLQTTDRNELQIASEKTIDKEFSLDAGVNTSGRYGLTKVETSLDMGIGRSSSESRSSLVQLAKEVISSAVDRVFESTRKLRRLTISEQIRELNIHSIKNIALEGGEAPVSRSGVYLWVEKTLEVELRHYGTRLMLEFHIPEPAISLLGIDKTDKKTIRKPAPLTIGPADISQANYLCLSKLYGAQDIEPPPSPFISVGYKYKSTSDENATTDNSQETVGEIIDIPDNYIPVSIKASIHTVKENTEIVFYLAIGGVEVIYDFSKGYTANEVSFPEKNSWHGGLPVSFNAHGHYHKSVVVHAVVRCERSLRALDDWKLRTWEKIREAHEILVREYEQAVEVAEFEDVSLFQIRGQPESENRLVEREELRKWAIKTMRLSSFNFDAVDLVGDYHEINPLDADLQAPIVKFYEEAFEWRQMSFFLYPYFWGRRDAWKLRQQIANTDKRHEAFLRAGAARVVVPVTPGFEDRVLFYLDSIPPDNRLDHDEFLKMELSRINGPSSDDIPIDSDAEDLWLELLINKNEALALGSGTLSVKKDARLVTINDDSIWTASDRDLGRELYISGEQYVVESVVAEKQFNLNEPYKGITKENVLYATGSVPYGQPWLVNIPTSLVILSDESTVLKELF